MSKKNNNKKQSVSMVQMGSKGGTERYVAGVGFGGARNFETDTSVVFDEQHSGNVQLQHLTIGGKIYDYVSWGDDDQFPYEVRNRIGDCMITAQSQLFNAQTTYGQGLLFTDKDTKKPTENEDFKTFDLINNLKQTYLEMCVDMVNYYFAVVVFILNEKGDRIVHIHQKEAQNCRFDPNGKYIFYGNFENGADVTIEKEKIEWLDINHPVEDFLMRTGRIPNKQGLRQQTKTRKFAMVCRFPTVGFQFYPHMSYLSIFRDHWYDMYRLIGEGKKSKIRNSTAPRYLVEVQKEYWDMICDNEGIYDIAERVKRVKKEKENIEAFVCGINNSGKIWITGAYVDPNGKEISMVKVTNLDTKKEGGDWADDIQEASNVLCFALGVHPNLIGATPGKSQMNNSGSDKRELFTLKQTLMIPFRDMLLPPFELLLYFNKYEGIKVSAPIVQLTTLDEHKDKKTTEPNQEGE